MKALVVSNRHELLPVFNRLRQSGHDAQHVFWSNKWEYAWEGIAEKMVRRSDGTLRHEKLQPVIDEAREGQIRVLTTTPLVSEWFSDAPYLFGPGPKGWPAPHDSLLFGGWFDGETLQAPHILVPDWGAWPGGLGPAVLGGLTLVRLGGNHGGGLPSLIEPALEKVTQGLKSAGFRGLFHFDVEEEPQTGELQLRGVSAGWPWLHTQAWLAELRNFAEVLEGDTPELGARFVTVLPVTQPPWPNPRQGSREGGVEIQGLTPQQQRQCFWFDIMARPEEGKLLTAGLDGLLAVATGYSDSTPALARHRALELALRLQVPEKQFRSDAGMLVDNALATLEGRWGVLI